METIKHLAYGDYLQLALALNNQKNFTQCEYTAVRVKDPFTFDGNGSSLNYNKHRSTRQFWFIQGPTSTVIQYLPLREFRACIAANNHLSHIVFLINYSRTDLPTSHIGSLWYSTKTQELSVLDPNGLLPFETAQQFFEMYAYELKMKYIEPPRVNLNRFADGYCLVINLYIIYKISTGQYDPKNIHTVIEKQCDLSIFLSNVMELLKSCW